MASRGLLAALGGAAKYGLAEDQRRKDEASEERKLRMKMQLEQELWKAKTEYAKANPEFAKFMQDSVTGDTIGFDQFGRSSILRKASEAETTQLREDRDLEQRVKKAQIGAAEAQAAAASDNAASNTEYRRMMAEAAKSRAAAYANRPPSRSSRIEPTEAQLQASVIETLKRTRPEWFTGGIMPEPGDAEYEEFNKEFEAEIARRRAARGTPSSGVQNHISTAPMQQPSEADMDFDDPSLYPDRNN